MTAIGALLEHPYAQALSWALVHFVWQGAAIGLAAWLIWRYAGWSARARYATGVAAMALMFMAPIVTVAMVGPRSAAPSSTAGLIDKTPAPGAIVAAEAPPARVVTPVEPVEPGEPFEPFVLALWLSGVLVLSARLLGGWFVARRFTTTGIAPVTEEIEQMARRIARDIGLARLVRLFESTRVAVPVTIGWLKPVVLLPVTALSGLSASQIEALLAHELAHVRRHDYLVNLLQSAVETLLFYHPVVWWISARVRAEREDCCDDLAVRVCDRLVYVRALTDLASLSQPRLALAATDGSLVHRVRRILGEPGRDGATGSGWLSVMLALAIVGGVTPVMVASVFGPEKKEPLKQATADRQVVGGVAGGVSGGVASGVAGGVTGGVEGGVVGGVPGGVPGGVAVGVVEDVQSGDPASQAALRRLREAQAMEDDIARRVRDAQQSIELERLMLEMKRLEAAHVSERQFLAEQLEGKKREMDALKARVLSGAATADELARLETELRLLEVKRSTLDQTLALAMRDIELKQRQAEQLNELARRKEQIADVRRAVSADVEDGILKATRAYEQAAQQYAQVVAEKEKARAGGLVPTQESVARADRARNVLAQREAELAGLRSMLPNERGIDERRLAEDVRRLVEQSDRRTRAGVADELALAQLLTNEQNQLRAALLAREARLAETATAIEATDTARAGDIVRVELHNEPDLPQAFTVQNDGTIRLPLVGSVKVAGLNPKQVQDAVRKQFTDRRLEAGATAVVSVRRPRTSRDGAGR